MIAKFAALALLLAASCATPAPSAPAEPAQVPEPTAPSEPVGDPVAVVDIMSSVNGSCYRLRDGRTMCTGSDYEDRFHTDYHTTDEPVASDRFTTDDIDIHLGSNFGCGLRKDGDVWCWGSLNTGVRGNGCVLDRVANIVCDSEIVEYELDHKQRKTKVGPMPPARQIEGGWESTCALTGGGEVWCWGWNLHGSIGDPDADEAARPVHVEVPKTSHIHAGAHHYCVIADEDRRVWCWGSHFIDDEPNPYERDVREPKPILSIGPMRDGAKLRTTMWGACVLENNAARCWGSFELTDGGPVKSRRPIVFDDVIDVAAANHHTCVVSAAGTVSCASNEPLLAGVEVAEGADFDWEWRNVDLPTSSPVKRLIEHPRAMCAWTRSGEIACWGDRADHLGVRVAEDAEYVVPIPTAVRFE